MTIRESPQKIEYNKTILIILLQDQTSNLIKIVFL